jgi:hypothetical protein
MRQHTEVLDIDDQVQLRTPPRRRPLCKLVSELFPRDDVIVSQDWLLAKGSNKHAAVMKGIQDSSLREFAPG